MFDFNHVSGDRSFIELCRTLAGRVQFESETVLDRESVDFLSHH